MSARYRHYRNLVEGGMTGFFTTTCLDFNHAFKRATIRDHVCYRICDDCVYYGAVLLAYSVMSNHLHLIARMPENMSGSVFMQRLKEHIAKDVLPLLTPDEHAGFDHQRGLNKRMFWQVSFDSYPLNNDKAFRQKLDYIHNNPVEAGILERPEQYRWSSARFYEPGGWPEDGLALYARGFFSTSG